MIKIFYFKDEDKYKRLYFFNIKLFKIKKRFSNKHIKNIIKNIELKVKSTLSIQTPLTPMPNELILNTIKELNDFYFIANAGNLGDAIIANSEFQILNSLKQNLQKVNYAKPIKITTPFNFIYGGGGLFLKIYKENLEEIFDILKNKLLKQCVILHSSFNNIPELIEIIDARFTIFCREKKSYDYLTSANTKAKIYLSDDMAFATDVNFYCNSDFTKEQLNNLKENLQNMSLTQIKQVLYDYFFSYSLIYNKTKEILNFINQQDKFKIVYLLRNDSEKNIANTTNINSFDLSDCGRIRDKSCFDNAYVQIISELFFSAVDCADIIVTDRLHVGISAALLNKEVFLFDNNYGKISGVYEQSMKSMKNVHLLKQNNLENIDNIIKSYNIKNTANSEHLKNMNLNTEQFLLKYLAYKNIH